MCPTKKLATKSVQVASLDDELKTVMDEVGAMLQLKHENIVKFYNFSCRASKEKDPFSKYDIT